MDELMLKIENVSKEYKLGQIGGTTLREDLQRLFARLFKKEDPTKRIGARNFTRGAKFMALDGVSLEVKKGERIGIIGHNGAGKSTLLKLICRITAPTQGSISLNGRIASMLEVGTGFHPELTGRENVYMNGAILGMTKKEIDAKMEDIIEFSEVRQFIDTPVKRYSSGMFVKLAFSVAAHLDSEIMIMDEVLAVGDMAFQQKCLTKMRDVSNEEGRTILYVSHNMNTIRQLCDRVVVLDHGKVVFNGDIEEGIGVYMNIASENSETFVYLGDRSPGRRARNKLFIQSLEFLEKESCSFERGEKAKIRVGWKTLEAFDDIKFRIMIKTPNDNIVIGTAASGVLRSCKEAGEYYSTVSLDTSYLVRGTYLLNIEFFQQDDAGNAVTLDFMIRACSIIITEDNCSPVNTANYGYIRYPELEVLE